MQRSVAPRRPVRNRRRRCGSWAGIICSSNLEGLLVATYALTAFLARHALRSNLGRFGWWAPAKASQERRDAKDRAFHAKISSRRLDERGAELKCSSVATCALTAFLARHALRSNRAFTRESSRRLDERGVELMRTLATNSPASSTPHHTSLACTRSVVPPLESSGDAAYA